MKDSFMTTPIGDLPINSEGMRKLSDALALASTTRADINPEKGLKESEEWCDDCEHIEMCRWYPTQGCEFKSGLHPELRKKWSNQSLFPDGFGGVKVGYTCPYCHKYVPYAGKYCGKCGERVLGGENG